MPTNHDETLHERYAREHQAQMAIYARMTPEQISELVTDLHNALARLAALESQQAASVGGERGAFERWCPLTTALLPNGHDYISANTRLLWETWQARAALLPAGGGVVMPERRTADDYEQYIEPFQSEAAAIFNSALDAVARLNAKPQANSQEEM